MSDNNTRLIQLVMDSIKENRKEIRLNRDEIQKLREHVAGLNVKAGLWGAVGCALLYALLSYVLKF